MVNILTYNDIRAWAPSVTQLQNSDGVTIDYVWSDSARLAVQVALATDRALLLRGEPGIGKTSLAEAAATELGWRFYRHTTTSRTEASDTLWRLDLVRRLGDAQVGSTALKPDVAYVEPREFWWAFDRASAFSRGAQTDEVNIPAANEPNAEVNQNRSPNHAVVLVDEIDKADPSVPNDMLELLSERQFCVENVMPIRRIKWCAPSDYLPPLLILTTNEERDLPEAFLRRCIVHTLTWPGEGITDINQRGREREFLLKVVKNHWQSLGGKWDKGANDMVNLLVGRIEEERCAALESGQRKPGLAELIDAVRAVRRFGIAQGDALWGDVLRMVWRKAPDPTEV